jgi:molybdate transport system regulatory protein
MLGPGKADLLERIRDTGSIAAAGRAMGMSYKRAWMLVETMNALFAAPLVESQRGGAGFGGAALTETGAQVLALWRRLEAKAAEAAMEETAALEAMLADMSEEK